MLAGGTGALGGGSESGAGANLTAAYASVVLAAIEAAADSDSDPEADEPGRTAAAADTCSYQPASPRIAAAPGGRAGAGVPAAAAATEDLGSQFAHKLLDSLSIGSPTKSRPVAVAP